MKNFKKCKICGIPLNREIVSKKNPEMCFKCAEEDRAFSFNDSQEVGKGKKCSKCSKPLTEHNVCRKDRCFCKSCYQELFVKKTKPIKKKKGFWASIFKRK